MSGDGGREGICCVKKLVWKVAVAVEVMTFGFKELN